MIYNFELKPEAFDADVWWGGTYELTDTAEQTLRDEYLTCQSRARQIEAKAASEGGYFIKDNEYYNGTAIGDILLSYGVISVEPEGLERVERLESCFPEDVLAHPRRVYQNCVSVAHAIGKVANAAEIPFVVGCSATHAETYFVRGEAIVTMNKAGYESTVAWVDDEPPLKGSFMASKMDAVHSLANGTAPAALVYRKSSGIETIYTDEPIGDMTRRVLETSPSVSQVLVTGVNGLKMLRAIGMANYEPARISKCHYEENVLPHRPFFSKKLKRAEG